MSRSNPVFINHRRPRRWWKRIKKVEWLALGFAATMAFGAGILCWHLGH